MKTIHTTLNTTEFGLPVKFHFIKCGRLRHRSRDVICSHLHLDSVKLVHPVQHVASQDHTYVVLRGLKDTVCQCTVCNYKLNLDIKTFTCHLHLCCQGTTQTCHLWHWSACACVFHLPYLHWQEASAATETDLCRPSDHPDSLVDAAPRGHRLRTSLEPRSGEETWPRKLDVEKIEGRSTWLRVGPYPVSCIPG